jgi:pseudaminic acid cytidylyltransferase
VNNIVAILPARGGSRRIAKKNIKPFYGRPIIQFPIDAVWESGIFDHVFVSTDDAEIANAATRAEIVWRPTCDGTKGTQEVAREVLVQMPEVEYACVIYPCSPLLLPVDLVGGFNALMFDYVMSVGPDLEDAGCFYWGLAESFRAGVSLEYADKYILPAERVCDINVHADWERAEHLYQAMRMTHV